MKNLREFTENIAVLGGGNLGQAIVRGFLKSKKIKADQITITDKHRLEQLDRFKKRGCRITDNNEEAVSCSDFIIVAVRPEQSAALFENIKGSLDVKKHIVISVMTGITTKHIHELLGDDMPVVRVMPNTAVAVGESMTCISSTCIDEKYVNLAKELFELVGHTMSIDEKDMAQATVICASGIAFFLRTIRATSQGGIQIGFHPNEALDMAAQTAKGASSLLLYSRKHPEDEIDRVTTPRGITIAGLNQMEHEGLSSAIIKGIITSAQIVEKIVKENN